MITIKKHRWHSFFIALVFFFTMALEIKFSVIDVKAISGSLLFRGNTSAWGWNFQSADAYLTDGNTYSGDDGLGAGDSSGQIIADPVADIELKVYTGSNASTPSATNTLIFNSNFDGSNTWTGPSGIYTITDSCLIIASTGDPSNSHPEFSFDSFDLFDHTKYSKIGRKIKVEGFNGGSSTGSVELTIGATYIENYDTTDLTRSKFQCVDKVVFSNVYGTDPANPDTEPWFGFILNNFTFGDPVYPTPPAAPSITGLSTLTGTNANYTKNTTPTIQGTGAEAGSTVTLYKNTVALANALTPTATVTADSDGKWSFTLGSPLSEGIYSLIATATDAAGNESDPSAAFSLTVDTTAPICDVANNTVHNTAITPSSPDTDIASAVLKKGTTTVSGYTLGTTQVSDEGSYTLTLTDKAGNDAVINFKIDKAVNIPTISTSPQTGTVKGGTTVAFFVNFIEPITVTGTPTLHFTVGSTPKTVTGSASGTNLTFLYTVESGLTDTDGIRINGIDCTVTDEAGNAANIANITANLISLKIDSTAPEKPTCTLSPGSDTGVSNDKITSNAAPTLTGTAETGTSVEIYDGAAKLGTVTAVSGAWTYTPSSALAEGTHDITAKSIDDGTNSTVSDSLSITIDTTKPTITAPTSGAALNSVTPAFGSESASDLTLTLTKNGANVAGYSGGNITDNGNYTLTATDKAGNTSDPVSFSVDSTPPTITAITASLPNGSSIRSGNVVTISIQFSKNITVTDTPTLLLNIGTQTIVASYDEVINSNTLRFTYTVSAGQNDPDGFELWSLTGTIKDLAGNPANLSFAGIIRNTGIKVDTTAPAAPVVTGLTPASDTGDSDSDRTTNDATPEFYGTAEAGCTVNLYDTAAPSILLGSATATPAGEWKITSSTLTPGLHSIIVDAVDKAGNTATSLAISITIDTAKPTITNITNGSTYGGIIPTFEDYVGASGTSSPGSLAEAALFKGTTPQPYTLGTAITTSGTYTLTVTDLAGNVSDPVTFTIDTAKPTILSIVRKSAQVTNADTVEYTVTFSKNVSGVSASSFMYGYDGTVNTTGITVTPVSGSVYTVTFSNVSGDGPLHLSFSKKTPPDIHDDYGNYIDSEPLLGESYIIDNTPIAVTNITDGQVFTVSSVTPLFDSVPASVTLKKDTADVPYTAGQPISGSGSYTLTVTDPAGNSKTIGFTLPQSSEKKITSFKIGTAVGTINETAHTIAITVPYGTNVTSLTPTIAVSGGAAVSPASGAAKNFTAPVTYTVTAEDSTTQTYTVTVTVAAQVTTPTTPTSTSASNNPPSDPPSTPAKTITLVEAPTDIPNPSLISINASQNAFNQSVEVRLKDDPIARQAVEDALKNSALGLPADAAIFPLDISLYIAGTNTKVQPNSGENVEIICPIPESLLANKEKLTVVCIIDGKLTVLPVKLIQKNGVWCISFTASHFSPYAFVVDSEGKLTSLAAGSGVIDFATPIVQNGMPYIALTCAMILLGIAYKKRRKAK